MAVRMAGAMRAAERITGRLPDLQRRQDFDLVIKISRHTGPSYARTTSQKNERQDVVRFSEARCRPNCHHGNPLKSSRTPVPEVDMADNYLLFSEIVPKLGPDEEAWLQAQLQQIAVHGDEETAIDGLDDQAIEGADWYGPRFLRDYGDFDFESDTLGFAFCFQDDTDPDGWGRHLWVFAEESGDPNHVVHLVRKFLKRFRPDQCWSLT
jgi:hypothetical protein